MAPSVADAAMLLHTYGTDDVPRLLASGVTPSRILAWKARARGLNAYFYRFPANDQDAAHRAAYTDDEVYCMRWLKSKGCTLPLGIVAATWFPQR